MYLWEALLDLEIFVIVVGRSLGYFSITVFIVLVPWICLAKRGWITSCYYDRERPRFRNSGIRDIDSLKFSTKRDLLIAFSFLSLYQLKRPISGTCGVVSIICCMTGNGNI